MNLSKLLLGILILAMLAAVAPLGAAAAEGDARAAAMLSITADEANEHVAKLADDTFEGRESGSRGGRAAGIYIVERLKSLGIKGALPKGGYYQNFGVYSNILASIEGRDPLLNQQAIVVGAHYDHVGYGNARNSLGPTGFIHNGADDNASGVAGLLEVADAIARLPRPPKRTILFAFWDGEERGLLGSKHWVDQPTVPLAQVPIVLNADMIGRMRGNRVIVYGSRSIAGLRRLVCRQNDASDLTLDFSWELKGDSDHYTFISRNIPVLMLFTGLHEDYHRPSDDVEKINKDGMERISRLIFNVVMELAEADVLGSFRHEVQQESSVATQRHAERPLAPPPGRLGIRWDETRADEGTIVIKSVGAGSAAQTGGLRAGDRLLRFAGRELADVGQLRRLVLAAENPVAVVVERPGEEEPRELTLELPGSPARLGIGWRSDDAEPGVVIVNRLTPGSVAEAAGIRPGDRIQRLGGRGFADPDEFRERVASEPGGATAGSRDRRSGADGRNSARRRGFAGESRRREIVGLNGSYSTTGLR